jgi:predicted lipid-binding transport protein (Tim44 family)
MADKKKKKKNDKKTPHASDRITIKSHPRAAGSIRRTKARGGMIGFAIGALAAWMHGGLMASVVLHGLEGGVAGYLACWFAAVTIWRHVIYAELRQAVEKRKAELAMAAAD